MESINQILLLLLIGMVTVFAVLSLVVATGTVLIKWVNALEKVIVKKEDDQHKAVLAAAVSIVTQGKAQIVKIKKINKTK